MSYEWVYGECLPVTVKMADFNGSTYNLNVTNADGPIELMLSGLKFSRELKRAGIEFTDNGLVDAENGGSRYVFVFPTEEDRLAAMIIKD